MNAPPQKKPMGKGVITLIVVISVCVLSVPCVGVLSAIAIPAFVQYINRSKTAEARSNLNQLFHLADSYYASENWGGGVATTACAVSSGTTPNTPHAGKTMVGTLGEPFDSLGFALRDPVYFQYEVVSTGGCDYSPGDPIYTFRAHGDLDGDGVTSLYELAVEVGSDGSLRRSPGIYTENEFE